MMLSTWLFTIATAVVLVIAVWSIQIAMHAVNCANKAVEIANDALLACDEKTRSEGLQAQIASLQAEMLAQVDATGAIANSLRKLRSRITMRENRKKNRGVPTNGGAAPYESPTDLKSRLRRELKMK